MSAIRFVINKGTRSSLGSLYLACHVRPGASNKRQGILSVSDSEIELCVAAQAKHGEANKAVRELIADVLGVAKSDVEITKGLKSRYKTIVVQMKSKSEEDKTVEETVSKFLDAAI